ncbi:MAG TPA: hypothetical protein VF145_10060 [Chitinophagaceae bacterium]
MKNIVIAVLFVFCSSCYSVKYTAAKLIFNVSEPKVISKEKILATSKRYKLDRDRILYFRNIFEFADVQNNEIKGIPDIIVIDSLGRHLLYAVDSIHCNGNAFTFIDKIIAGEPISFDTGLIRTGTPDRLKGLRYLEGDQLVQPDKTKPYQVYIMWASYVGRLNTTFARKLQEKLKMAKNVDYYLVNMDMNQVWGVKMDKTSYSEVQKGIRHN